MSGLAAAGAKLLGEGLASSAPIHGGDLSEVVQITLDDGRSAIVKGGSLVEVEARMLQAMAKSGATVPEVYAVGRGVLVMELLPARGGSAWASLGAAVATLHSATSDHYGWHEDYAFGRVSIPNDWSESWPNFWGERRLLTHCAHISSDLAGRLERLAPKLDDLLPQRPAPALLHGDLWSGNVLFDGDRLSGLIDPACYYGHAEVDFAMLELFGGPSPAFYSAYGTTEPGRRERLPIYQLWPALVHLRLFGSGYRPMVERLLAAVGH